MRFRIDQEIAATLSDVEDALLNPEFIAATARLPKLGAPEVLDQQRDGERVRQRVRYHFTGELSSAVRRVVSPKRLSWIDDVRFDLSAHTARHRIQPDYYADRLEASYDVTFQLAGERTRRVATGELEVHVPLVGGRVERAIVSGITEHAHAEAALLGTWIANKRA